MLSEWYRRTAYSFEVNSSNALLSRNSVIPQDQADGPSIWLFCVP
jgi:hypothetical protein